MSPSGDTTGTGFSFFVREGGQAFIAAISIDGAKGVLNTMSFDSGPGAYAPPSPKKGLSPWAWVGIGCGTITLLGIGTCTVGGAFLARSITDAASPEESMKAIQAAQIPIYPGSEMDAPTTKVAGGTINLMARLMGKGVKMNMVAFRCPDVASTVHPWYAQKTAAMGFMKQTNGEQSGTMGRNMEQHMYVKGKDMIMVQTQDPEGGKKGCILIVAHFANMPGK
jgi:hypothetical protein